MKIAIDTLPLKRGDRIRGMGFYVKSLLEHIPQADAFLFKENSGKLKKYDLLHYPYFDLFSKTLSNKHSSKFVVTVPDVTPLLYPNRYPPGIKGKLNFNHQKKALKKADAVITLSETSKKDIVRFLDYPADRIFPIYLAPQTKAFKGAISTLKLPKKYVLYVGDANYNKNINRLAEACIKVKMPLVLVGKQLDSDRYDKDHPENEELVKFHKKYKAHKLVKTLGYLKDDDFQYVWQNALIYCQPSLYEGFGMPVVEAFEMGVPVLCSRTQALVEVAGNGAFYFDPYDAVDLSKKILQLDGDEKLRKDLVKAGKARGKQFSWEKTAKETIAVYEKVASVGL